MGKLFWFSATGNSYKAAHQIAEKSAGKYELIKITDSLIASSPVIEESEIGFVFPVYGWTLPTPVKNFIEAADFKNTEYCFSVITMGGSAAKAALVLKNYFPVKGFPCRFMMLLQCLITVYIYLILRLQKGKAHIAEFIEKSIKKVDEISDKIIEKAREFNIGKNIFGYFFTYIIGSSFSMQYKRF